MSRLIIRILERNETPTDDVGTALDWVDHTLQWAWIRSDQSSCRGNYCQRFIHPASAADRSRVGHKFDYRRHTSEQVLMLSCSVPGRNSGQIRQALPYALEEHVATDIETMHIAVAQ